MAGYWCLLVIIITLVDCQTTTPAYDSYFLWNAASLGQLKLYDTRYSASQNYVKYSRSQCAIKLRETFKTYDSLVLLESPMPTYAGLVKNISGPGTFMSLHQFLSLANGCIPGPIDVLYVQVASKYLRLITASDQSPEMKMLAKAPDQCFKRLREALMHNPVIIEPNDIRMQAHLLLQSPTYMKLSDFIISVACPYYA